MYEFFATKLKLPSGDTNNVDSDDSVSDTEMLRACLCVENSIASLPVLPQQRSIASFRLEDRSGRVDFLVTCNREGGMVPTGFPRVRNAIETARYANMVAQVRQAQSRHSEEQNRRRREGGQGGYVDTEAGDVAVSVLLMTRC